ncbi:MAG: choice-of-anchor Q domain-containing protein, partial [Planctomycetota bacterium]
MTGSHGGAVAVSNSVFNMSGGAGITGNSTPAGASRGGGVYAYQSVLNFSDDVLIARNRTTGSNSQGGAIFASQSEVNLTNAIVSLNETTGTGSQGGGIYVEAGAANISDTLLSQNNTSGAGAWGGGLFNDGGEVEFYESSVILNTVSGLSSNGGGIVNLGGNLLVRDSEVSQNEATWDEARGGGVYSETGLLGPDLTSIVNSTVSGNFAARRGGGVFNAGGRTELSYSTVTDNTVPFNNVGAGVASLGSTLTTLTSLESTIVAGNNGGGAVPGTDIDFVDGDFENSFLSLGYNLVGTGDALPAFDQPGDQINVLDPMLEPLADNGGPTRTHALMEGSPAINAGNPNFDPNDFDPPLEFDQRGAPFARVNQGRIDIGAFESDFSTTGPADFDDNGVTDGFDFLAWQRGYGIDSEAAKSDGDANSDQAVDQVDLGIWEATFGDVAPLAPAAIASAFA